MTLSESIKPLSDGTFHINVKGNCRHYDWSAICHSLSEALDTVERLREQEGQRLGCEWWSCNLHYL